MFDDSMPIKRDYPLLVKVGYVFSTSITTLTSTINKQSINQSNA